MYKNQIGEITATFVPVEIFKGNLPADKKVKSWAFGPGNCTIPILAGVDYVFFIDPKEQGFITSLDGSFMAFTLESGEVKNALDEMRKYKK